MPAARRSKVPGVIESLTDVFDMPVKVDGDRVVTFGDVGWIPTFKDPDGFARIDGDPLWCWRFPSAGANLIATGGVTRRPRSGGRAVARAARRDHHHGPVRHGGGDALRAAQQRDHRRGTGAVVIPPYGGAQRAHGGLNSSRCLHRHSGLIWAIGYTLNIVRLRADPGRWLLVDGAIAGQRTGPTG
ncbi:hypothetical protein DSL92_04035 [Billgrantia gudaonensis]|uniref:Uncharacterized protein n=1 Tax=Billgrantia gudaonensis TaxID=376427 RepID=A0A3S0Q1D1_9GAMM|nr:hypothetical protein DSL92_04035 [Halomonas gudaonensis]